MVHCPTDRAPRKSISLDGSCNAEGDEMSLVGTWRRNWRFWLGILLSLVTLGWLAYTTEWAAVGTALREMDYRWVLVATLLNLISVPLRTVRWRLMFPPAQAPPWRRLTSALLIGQAVNVLAPAPRLGDLLRASLVGLGSTAYALGTLVIEKALDLLLLAALVMLLLSQVTLPAWWQGSGQALVVTAAGALLVVVVTALTRKQMLRILERLEARWPQKWVRRILAAARQILGSLDALRWPVLLPALACSVLLWCLYAAVNYVLLRAIGQQLSVLAALFLLAVLQLGVAVPSSPGRIGVYHYLCIQALAVFGVADAPALSYAIALHLISVVLPMALGAVLAWQLGVSLHPRANVTES